MNYLLDTNICIALLKSGDQPLKNKIKQYSPTDFVLCSIVKAELLYGAKKSQRVTDNLALLKMFFAQFESLPFDDRAAEFYGTIRSLLTKAGTPIGANDLIIASIAEANDVTVITRNVSEYERVPGLKVEVW